jgi:hypothetical protein
MEIFKMSYRPFTDVWILARPKSKYFGVYPAGFLATGQRLNRMLAGRSGVTRLQRRHSQLPQR